MIGGENDPSVGAGGVYGLYDLADQVIDVVQEREVILDQDNPAVFGVHGAEPVIDLALKVILQTGLAELAVVLLRRVIQIGGVVGVAKVLGQRGRDKRVVGSGVRRPGRIQRVERDSFVRVLRARWPRRAVAADIAGSGWRQETRRSPALLPRKAKIGAIASQREIDRETDDIVWIDETYPGEPWGGWSRARPCQPKLEGFENPGVTQQTLVSRSLRRLWKRGIRTGAAGSHLAGEWGRQLSVAGLARYVIGLGLEETAVNEVARTPCVYKSVGRRVTSTPGCWVIACRIGAGNGPVWIVAIFAGASGAGVAVVEIPRRGRQVPLTDPDRVVLDFGAAGWRSRGKRLRENVPYGWEAVLCIGYQSGRVVRCAFDHGGTVALEDTGLLRVEPGLHGGTCGRTLHGRREVVIENKGVIV